MDLTPATVQEAHPTDAHSTGVSGQDHLRPLLHDLTLPSPRALGPLLAAALDEIDVGVALVDAGARPLHLNHRAQAHIASGSVLTLREGRIAAQFWEDAPVLYRALGDAAERSFRRLIHIGRGEARCSVAVVPVQPGVAALMLSRSHLCEGLSLQGFARAHGLSDAESRVLAALGSGQTPVEIARAYGVALSTVRTQIGAIRSKTGTASIRELLRRVAALPPLVGALRH